MIVKSLTLENIRSYKNEEIIFEDGISLLSGDIGSGKSSVLQAIEFALLGFKKGDLEGIQILRKGSSEGSVKLTLLDTKINSQVEIYRRLKKAKNSDSIAQENGYLKFDEELVEMGPEELNSQLFQILNFPIEFIKKDKNLLYRFTIYTAQEQLKEILYAEPEKRLELLRKLFQIDKYKQIKQAISLYLVEMKSKKKEFEVKLENESRVKEEIKELESQIKEITLSEKKIKLQEKEIKDKIKVCDSSLKKIEEVRTKYNEMILKLEKALSNLESYEEQKEILSKEVRILKEEKENLSFSKIKEKEKVLVQSKVKIDELIIQISKKQLEIKKSLELIGVRKKEQEKLREEIKVFEIKKESLLQMKNSFDYVLTKCKLKDCQVEIKKLETKFKNLEKKKKLLEVNLLEYNELELKIKLSKEISNDFELRLKNFKSLDKCPHCFTLITKENEKNILSHMETEKSNEEDRIKKYDLKFKDLNLNQKKLKEELKDYEHISNKIIQLKEKESLLVEQEEKERSKYKLQKELQKELELLSKKNLLEKQKEFDLILEQEKKLNIEFDSLSQKEKESQKELSNIDLEFEKLRNVQKNLENNEKETLSKNKRITLISKQLEKKKDYEKKLRIMELKNKEMNLKKEKYESHKDTLSQKEKEYINLISNSSTKKEERENYVKKYLEQLKEFQLLKKEFEKLIELESFLSSKAYTIVDSLERKLFARFYVEFNESFEYYFKQLIEDNEIEVRLDEEFTPLVEQNGHDVSINTLSGGEKSSLAIAYKLGLKKIVEQNIKKDSGLNMLILDEPTDGFSTEQIDRLGLLLKESEVEQTLLVSHDEKLESIASNILRVEKKNHISVISNS